MGEKCSRRVNLFPGNPENEAVEYTACKIEVFLWLGNAKYASACWSAIPPGYEFDHDKTVDTFPKYIEYNESSVRERRKRSRRNIARTYRTITHREYSRDKNLGLFASVSTLQILTCAKTKSTTMNFDIVADVPITSSYISRPLRSGNGRFRLVEFFRTCCVSGIHGYHASELLLTRKICKFYPCGC